MPFYTKETSQFFSEGKSENIHWQKTYKISDKVPVSGIYRCVGCGDEITSNAGDPFPPQNTKQHPCSPSTIKWKLVARTKTKG